MIARKPTETRQQYPGLQDGIRKLLHAKPNEVYDVGRLIKSFHGTPPNSIHYHLMRLKEKGEAENVKRGFWRAAVPRSGSTVTDIATVRQAVSEMPKRVVDAGPGTLMGGTIAPITQPKAEPAWLRFAQLHASSIKARMGSSAPAAELFTDEDRSLLDLLLSGEVRV